MELRELNRWDLSPDEARVAQQRLAQQVVRTGEPANVAHVAGIDVAFPGGQTRAAVVVDSYPDLVAVESVVADQPTTFPYVPGLLSFREAPAIVAACRSVATTPDLIVVDGQGIAHPRGLGIASHIGLILDLPTIGCAKSLLVGRHQPVGNERGSWSPITYGGQTIGAALRTKAGVKPVYVSIGHRIGLEATIHWALELSRGYRLPEPQRQAHVAAGSAS
jgi:deoxyribonuclease V